MLSFYQRIEVPILLMWREARMSKNQHVVPSGAGRWSVRRADAERASGVYSTQREAIAAARGLARAQGVELFIHGQDGIIREHETPGKGQAKPAK